MNGRARNLDGSSNNKGNKKGGRNSFKIMVGAKVIIPSAKQQYSSFLVLDEAINFKNDA